VAPINPDIYGDRWIPPARCRFGARGCKKCGAPVTPIAAEPCKLHRLFERLRDDTDTEQWLLGCVQQLNLLFGVLFEPFGDIADQIAEDSCDLRPCCIAIRGIDAEIGQVAVGPVPDPEKI